jgi:hypothetical protein
VEQDNLGSNVPRNRVDPLQLDKDDDEKISPTRRKTMNL